MSAPIRSPPARRHRTLMEGGGGTFNPSPPAPSPQEPFWVSFTPGGIEISGRLSSSERADELIRAIEALKVLLPPADIAARPQEPKASDQTHENAPDRHNSKAALLDRGYTYEQIREMNPEEAHRALG